MPLFFNVLIELLHLTEFLRIDVLRTADFAFLIVFARVVMGTESGGTTARIRVQRAQHRIHHRGVIRLPSIIDSGASSGFKHLLICSRNTFG